MAEKCNRYPPVLLTNKGRNEAECPNDWNPIIYTVDFAKNHDTIGPVLAPRADVKAELN